MTAQINLYIKLLGLQNATIFKIVHEDAMVAEVYKISQSDGKQYILKICDRINDYLREELFLKHFASQILVPNIIQSFSPEKNRHGAILMEYLPGKLLQPNEFTGTLAFEIGKSLAKIHLNGLSGYGDPVDGNLNDDPRQYFTFKFNEGLAECRNHLPASLIEKCQKYFITHIDVLKQVDGPCIVHRDFRPGNIMVHNRKLQGIIDWSGARASFAEEDFCSIEYGDWSTKKESKQFFLAGYTSVRAVPNYLLIIPFLRLNKALATIGFTVKRGTWNNSHAKIYANHRNFLENLLL